MMRSVLSLIVAGTTLVACAHDPALHLTANSESPHVRVDVETRGVYQTEHVGTATQRDRNGNVVSTTDVTATHRVGRERYVASFQLMRGDSVIDERDYYHLAGDDQAAREIDAYRRRGILYNRIGLGITAVGVAGLVAMLAGSGTVRKVGSTAFAVGIPVGSILALMGVRRMRGHHEPLSRALSVVGQPMPDVGPVP